MSRTGVVTVTFGSPHLLDDHLATIDLPPGTLVVVVDNFSTAANRAAVAERCKRYGWTFVPVAGNPGFGGGSNRGAAVALALGCDVVVLLNPDCSCSREVFDALVAEARADPMAMAGPALRRSDGRVTTSWQTVDHRGRNIARPGFDGTWERDWLSTACVALGRPLWEATGGFDERYFLYWEDVDLARRVHEAGGRVVPRPDLEAVHDAGATQHAERSKSPLYIDMNCRNRLRYAALHETRAAQLRWLLNTPVASWKIARRAGYRNLFTSWSLQWAAIRGTVVGLALLARGRR